MEQHIGIRRDRASRLSGGPGNRPALHRDARSGPGAAGLGRDLRDIGTWAGFVIVGLLGDQVPFF
jgi:hypothetical protein